MSEINPICRSYGITAAKSLSANEGSQIASLDDLAKALKMYYLVKDATSHATELLKGLSDEAKELFSKAKVKDNPNDLDFIVKKFVETANLIDRLPTGKRARLIDDRVALIKIIELLQMAFDVSLNVATTLSDARVVMEYQDFMSKAQGASATQRVLNGLEGFVESVRQNLSPADKAALNIADSKKISDYSTPEIEGVEEKAVSLIKEICAPPIVAPPPVVVTVVAPPAVAAEEKEKSGFNAAARVGGGYDGRMLGNGGASAAYWSGNARLQLDYASAMVYKKTTDDSADVSYRYDGDSLDVLVKGGGLVAQRQEPGAVAATTTATQDLFLAYRLGIVSLNLAETLQAQIDGEGFMANADPSVSLMLGRFALTAGGAADYDGETSLGGLGGASYRSKKHDASALVRHTRGRLSAGARYFYNDFVGASAQYDILRGAHTGSATARAKVHLGKGFYFEPFAGGDMIDGKIVGTGGAILRYGELMPQNPNPLTPHSIDPLTEDK